MLVQLYGNECCDNADGVTALTPSHKPLGHHSPGIARAAQAWSLFRASCNTMPCITWWRSPQTSLRPATRHTTQLTTQIRTHQKAMEQAKHQGWGWGRLPLRQVMGKGWPRPRRRCRCRCRCCRCRCPVRAPAGGCGCGHLHARQLHCCQTHGRAEIGTSKRGARSVRHHAHIIPYHDVPTEHCKM